MRRVEDIKTIYVCGSMTGRPQWGFPSFDRARDRLIEEGWYVISPADMDRAIGFDPNDAAITVDDKFRQDAMRRDIAAVLHCDAVYCLIGWEGSAGAAVETAVAKAIGLEFIYEKYHLPEYIKRKIEQEKASCS